MGLRRVAVIYDGIQRPETTGLYCRRALGRIVDVEHFQPNELRWMPRTGFDLYLNIDDGLNYRLPTDLHPRVWWAIDTHLNSDWCLEKAGDFDFVFAAQKDGAEQLRRSGIETAAWLPLACDPEFHRKHTVAKRHDVAFVGNLFPGPRTELLGMVRSQYSNTFVGQRYFEEMARTYSEARMVFNRSLKNDVNMRVFEAIACGSLLITNDLAENGQEDLFQDGVHLATYRGPEELLDKLAYYLKKDVVRERIAAAGLAEAHAKHTYRHRMEQLLRETESRLSRVSATVGGRNCVDDANNGDQRNISYFDHERPEILAMVPRSAKYVLDIGCGAGRLGETVKVRQDAHVTGVEFNAIAAEVARSRLDRVVVGNVEGDIDFPDASFDVVICGDILEHLRNPDGLLRKVKKWLNHEGWLIASIPNVRHHSVIRSLLAGNWTYESAGLLDRDHVRFFTRREIEKLFFRAGFEVESLSSVGGLEDGEQQRISQGEVRVGRLQIGGLSTREAAEFHAYQYLLRATPAAELEYGLTSIIIPTHNQLNYTRLCLDSVQRLTDEPYELIVVDNASTDGTVEYLGTIPGLKLIRNETNRGFPAAVNQGIAIANGQQVLLLNNDTVATTGWLRRMLDCLLADPQIGLVGPCSNQVSGEQQVAADYDSLADLDGFAWDWGQAHRGIGVDTDRLVGFCLLIRRELIDVLGGFDERFGLGCFEDDDYTLRTLQAGYRAVIANDSFVHHFGGRTFVASGVDFARLMRENKQRFHEKWDSEATRESDHVAMSEPNPRSAQFVNGVMPTDDEMSRQPDAKSSPSWFASPLGVEMHRGGGLLLRPRAARLSLCMIVRDSARTLPACLDSIRPWVDEMIIVDTGSSDDTAVIALAMGARVFHFPWCDDFAVARNVSLEHASGDWLFWMDSDDTIPAECGRQLRELVNGRHPPAILGYVVQVHCPGDEGPDAQSEVTVVDHVKLIRNHPELRFEGRIHEQILPAIRRMNGAVAWTDLYVVHSGSDPSPAAQKRKRERDLRLLHLELQERPDHPFTLFNLGMTYADAREFELAADYLGRGIAQSNPLESHVRKAYALLLHSQMQLGRLSEAEDTCEAGLKLFPLDAELRFRRGILMHELGRHHEAVRSYLDVLGRREERHFTSVDRGITGFKARHNLAAVYMDMGRMEDAETQWREILRELPGYREGWRGLGETLLRQRRFPEAMELVGRLAADGAQGGSLRCDALVLKGRLAAAQGDVETAREHLSQAFSEFPGELEALRALCQFLFEYISPEDAEPALRELALRAPEDASVHHNLGLLALRQQRYQKAAESFQRSLELRPDAPATLHQLGYALNWSGHADEAVMIWKRAQSLSPRDSEISEDLRNCIRMGSGIAEAPLL